MKNKKCSAIQLKISDLKIEKIPYGGAEYETVVDSGTQISVFKSSVVGTEVDYKGYIMLQPAFGDCLKAELKELDIGLVTDGYITPEEENTRNWAHESVFRTHLGAHKTIQRIKFSFYWPGMVKEIKAYCSSYHGCQCRKVIRSDDKIPITPVSHPELPFQVVNVDLIGPVDPVSSQGHCTLFDGPAF
ncbi:retrovirus-related Pol polyprotein from transposon opus [Trichonephila clavipes]|nr:retrovirus-related Pol polyprotein from transposon opus [Trichonephila clavipes]